MKVSVSRIEILVSLFCVECARLIVFIPVSSGDAVGYNLRIIVVLQSISSSLDCKHEDSKC